MYKYISKSIVYILVKTKYSNPFIV